MTKIEHSRKKLLDQVDAMLSKSRLPDQTSSLPMTVDSMTALSLRLDALFEVNRIYRDQTLTGKRLSELLKTNTTYLSHLVNTYYKCSIPQFLNRYRVAEARALLADPANNNLTLEAVGRLCGFNSKSSFNRAFRDETGVTPQEFKNFRQKI